MAKITIYLPKELQLRIAHIARLRGCTEASIIRQAIQSLAANAATPKPRLPLFNSGKPWMAESADDNLTGFGV